MQKLELEFAYINWTELNLIAKIKNKLELLIKINKIDSNEEARMLKPWTDSLNSSKTRNFWIRKHLERIKQIFEGTN